jgi:hypothetical protein
VGGWFLPHGNYCRKRSRRDSAYCKSPEPGTSMDVILIFRTQNPVMANFDLLRELKALILSALVLHALRRLILSPVPSVGIKVKEYKTYKLQVSVNFLP